MPRQAWQIAEDEFQKFWDQFGKRAYVFAFHDTREAMGATGSRRVFTTQHPSDFLVVHEGNMFYAEVKSCSNTTSFPLSAIQPGQMAAAKQVQAAGGIYLFFIKNEVTQKWYKVPAGVFVAISNLGTKSIRWEDLKEFYFHELSNRGL